MYFPSSSCSSSSSSSSVYSSSQGSSTTSSSSHRGYRQPSLISRPSLVTHPTPVSLSSLRDLTATSSTYNPPSPSSSYSSPSICSPPTRSTSPTTATADSLDSLNLSSFSSRPIPIPKPVSTADLPVTPLTGRFEKGYYFAPQQIDQSPPFEEKFSSHRNFKNFDSHGRHHRSHRRRHHHHHHHHHHHNHNHHSHSHNLHQHHHQSAPSMRSDNSNFYSPVMSSAMPPSGRPASPQSSRSRAQNTTKSVPSFHLSNLPRFHPTVYPSTGSQTAIGQQQQQSQLPMQSRHHTYRQSSGSSSRDGMRQLMESVTSSRVPSGQYSPSPSAPRLDPLLSPGPVTPLVLEEGNSYLSSGASGATDPFARDSLNAGSASDKIAREGDRAWQKSSILSAKGR
ncbi:uncharacterized protein EURHEDRAFT_409724 [Aspergillus ruber CBS 135680]|uniref:Uncharacterized protein n=1 Tax=Aspergillus ruber (strain CBS 135680) TaxID=1388766 RepID=A0A017SML8_ASPRC|nr:uncharacterized protein EURHEDRAFT_409724 [Aspergillus ruber CBS 135680]EYE97510.1 hypothetical protein EURHEDRAFT_409724 [Aspergillus ruber CBS 135680]